MINLISYEELRRVQSLERDNKALQELDEPFFEKVREYIKSKEKIIEENKGKENTFAQEAVEKNEHELKNIQKILKDICSRRHRKIVLQALTNITARVHNTEKMLPEEETFYNEIIQLLKDNFECFFSKFKEREEELKKGEEELKLVRILEPIPTFAWKENTYGPCNKEDVINLPTEIAQLLIKEGKAMEIVVDNK